MKVDQDGHYFTHGQGSRSTALDGTTAKHVVFQTGQKNLAEIIDMHEQFE
jgi:hypothetical protein